MMEMSKRARRMERHHRQRKRPGVNLISLMDIFTILVFFLLVNSSNVQQIPSTKDLRLPTSVAATAPKETLVVFVTREKILLQGRLVADIGIEMARPGLLIDGLVDELKFQASQPGATGETVQVKGGRAITIMGDELIPYELLRKILASCREVDYIRVAFAALQKTKPRENSP